LGRRRLLLVPLVVLALSSCSAPLNAAKPVSGRTYSSTSFVVPFDISLPSWVQSGPPTLADRNFVTWAKKGDPDRVTVALRVMHPVSVVRPDNPSSDSVPADYLGYLRGLSTYDTHMSHVTTVKAGPYPTTLFTLTTKHPQDKSVGCYTATPTDEGCFAAQPGLPLRMAVLTVHKTLLLIWMRTSSTTHDLAKDSASFATMIKGLRFPARAVTS
jgi:hypothetical protein